MSGVNVCSLIRDGPSLLRKKKNLMVSPRSLELTRGTFKRTHTHTSFPRGGILASRHGNSGPPCSDTSPLSPLMSSPTLRDSPQSVKLEPCACDAVPAKVAVGGGEEQKQEGECWRGKKRKSGSKQVAVELKV